MEGLKYLLALLNKKKKKEKKTQKRKQKGEKEAKAKRKKITLKWLKRKSSLGVLLL